MPGPDSSLHCDFRDARRVGIVSDTHGAVDDRVAETLASCDLLVHAGDVGNADVLERLNLLRPLIAISGNNDTENKWPDEHAPMLRNLPESCVVSLAGGDLALVHGHQFNPVARRHEKLRNAFPTARAIVYGHSHRLVCDQDEQPWVVNPGAGGRVRTYGGASCMVLDVSTPAWTLQTHRFPR